jgi:ketosteroid isomerase-like protein/TolB-like protein
MCMMTHQGLNALLVKFDNLNVLSKEEIDFKRKSGESLIEIARDLGIRKMVNGTLVRQSDQLVLQMRMVDVASGRQESAWDASGTENQLPAIEYDVALQLVKLLKVPVTEGELARLALKPKTVDLDAAKRFNDAFGGDEDDGDAKPAKPAPPAASWLDWPPSAYAATADEDAIKALLDQYRTALQAKDLTRLATIYVSLSDNTRQALQRYFDSANDLTVQFSDETVLFDGDEALATFTRSDKFKDKDTGRDVNLEVRVSTVVSKVDGAWKIKALRKPS